MSDESDAGLKELRQVSQRQALRDFAAFGWQSSSEPFETITFGFAAHEEDIDVGTTEQPGDEFQPVFLRPIFCFAAAAGMNCDLVGRHTQSFDWQTRNGISVENGESFQWFKVNLRGMDFLAFIGPMWRNDELSRRTSAYIGPEDVVRVVQI